MKRSIYVKFGLGALAAVVVFGVRPCAGQINEAYPVIKPEKAAARRDPVAVAFAVPYGTVLNEKQQSEYERLKADKASDLREAIVAANAATDPAEKADLHKEVVKLQAEIRAAMQ